ncbi:MAG: GNAT family N-acetyltransferase [Muribaculaceae bacterium]|nr:GNAT family N-acetyltransferase [Muribaculaceae bacterium]
MEIKIRHASEADIEHIMPVYDSARAFMRRNGNITQWGNGYPSREQILTDIRAGVCYVGVDSDGRIAMVFAFIHGNDPTYTHIEDGSWLNDRPYATIHRIASSGLYGGMLRHCTDFCFSQIDNLRIDTHADNRPMQDALARLGFTRCGIIYIADGTPRTAYQKYQGIQ